MTDAIDELVARSKDTEELRKFHQFHRAHPEVLDFLVDEIDLLRKRGHKAFSYVSLWDYARWQLIMDKAPGDTFKMNDHLTPLYSRAIPILHPEFNGMSHFRTTSADDAFGTTIEAARKGQSEGYVRRLQWVDGTALEDGWRPQIPHVSKRNASRKPSIHGKGGLQPEQG
jgi:hypothetical protein